MADDKIWDKPYAMKRVRGIVKVYESGDLSLLIITFHVSCRRHEMYCGHARLCVCVSICLSAAACLHYWTDPDVT